MKNSGASSLYKKTPSNGPSTKQKRPPTDYPRKPHFQASQSNFMESPLLNPFYVSQPPANRQNPSAGKHLAELFRG